MQQSCSKSRTTIHPSKRLFSSCHVRLKPKTATKIYPMLKALELPPTPEIPQGTFSSRLRKRMQQKRSTTPKENKIDGVVYGWGEDILSNSHQKPPHDSRVNLSTLRKFEQEAFYRHDREPPQFDRRVQIWVQTSSDGRPTLETIEGLEPQPPVPTLAHSLDRVLFNSGPHWLRDPRSRVANFDEVLEKVPDIYDFDFGRIQPYVTSSKDDATKREGKKFTGSTSSLTSLLSHIFFLISNGREVDTSTLSSAFSKESKEFTYGARWPGGITLRHREGIYSIDSDGVNEPEKHLLLNMGTMLEKFLVHPTDEFDKLRRSTPLTDDTVLPSQGESYHYSKSDKFVMRAQLDAQDHRLPGSGVFDIKTRAVVAIRYDPLNHMDNSGYLIRSLQGPFESFEREQYDLIRAAFLKYKHVSLYSVLDIYANLLNSFQVRIGNMDGIFVAYHNTVLMFGFQYFTRQDMDERLFGGPVQGDRVFEQCVKCLETILSEITSCFPGVSVKCTFEASPDDPVMRIYVEPEEWDEETQGERPLVELFVSATSYLNGTRITGPMNFGTQDDHWGVLLNIARSSSNSPELRASIRKERDALLERKSEINFSLPRGMDAKTMAQKWVEIDYTRKPTVDADSNKDNAFSQVVSSISDEKLEQIALRFNSKRRPSKFVTNLRALAKQGRQYLDSLEQGLVEESNDPSVGPHLVRTGTTEVSGLGR
ncbi:Pet127-domain-containing protein [Serendipita vermifera]|nr:Pet127-domain-containing protein [Serendipita vermifera]